jgi:DNA-binding MarR family transcriptional regulator
MSYSLISDPDSSSVDLLLLIFALGRSLDVSLEPLLESDALTRSDLEVLCFLRRSSPSNPSQISTFFRITTGTIAVRINRLEDRGFLARQPDPGRRNGTLVVLTPQGLAIADKIFASLTPFSDRLLGRVFNPDELLFYRELTVKLLASLDQDL